MAKYRYNGTELPALPSVDESTFPYATIIPTYELVDFQFVHTGKYEVMFTVSPVFYYNSAGVIAINDTSADLRVIIYQFDGVEWVGNGNESELSIAWTTVYGGATWSNYDILNADGSVYLSASVPVPVLSWQSKTPYRRMNYQWVKQDTYKRVNGEWVKQDEFRRES